MPSDKSSEEVIVQQSGGKKHAKCGACRSGGAGGTDAPLRETNKTEKKMDRINRMSKIRKTRQVREDSISFLHPDNLVNPVYFLLGFVRRSKRGGLTRRGDVPAQPEAEL